MDKKINNLNSLPKTNTLDITESQKSTKIPEICRTCCRKCECPPFLECYFCKSHENVKFLDEYMGDASDVMLYMFCEKCVGECVHCHGITSIKMTCGRTQTTRFTHLLCSANKKLDQDRIWPNRKN